MIDMVNIAKILYPCGVDQEDELDVVKSDGQALLDDVFLNPGMKHFVQLEDIEVFDTVDEGGSDQLCTQESRGVLNFDRARKKCGHQQEKYREKPARVS